ncbi:MAG: hypothetical protein JWN25_1252 [Verrucomicrobiales bacterium]|nr:hypothetical protein [Verrucomicrobiales bacterium]
MNPKYKMQKDQPIPTPIQGRFKQARQQFLPVIVFVCVSLVTVYLWKAEVPQGNLVGQVELVTSSVSSVRPGLLSGFRVEKLQAVKKGEALGQVIVADPKIMAATLATFRGEIEMLRAGGSPMQNQERIMVEVERLRLGWMQQRVDLAINKVKLQQAESEFVRVEKMFKEQIAPEGGASRGGVISYEVARRDRDALKIEVTEKEKIVEEFGTKISSFIASSNHSTSTNSPLDTAIAIQDDKLKLAEAELSPVTLFSPDDGVISIILKRNGETVTANEPILSIVNTNSQRIIGYLRAPFNSRPSSGQKVMIQPRNARRLQMEAIILRVGSHFEILTPEFLPFPDKRTESGLPVIISKPAELDCLPGEFVDVVLK